jgi:hypothetical protein
MFVKRCLRRLKDNGRVNHLGPSFQDNDGLAFMHAYSICACVGPEKTGGDCSK